MSHGARCGGRGSRHATHLDPPRGGGRCEAKFRHSRLVAKTHLSLRKQHPPPVLSQDTYPARCQYGSGGARARDAQTHIIRNAAARFSHPLPRARCGAASPRDAASLCAVAARARRASAADHRQAALRPGRSGSGARPPACGRRVAAPCAPTVDGARPRGPPASRLHRLPRLLLLVRRSGVARVQIRVQQSSTKRSSVSTAASCARFSRQRRYHGVQALVANT